MVFFVFVFLLFELLVSAFLLLCLWIFCCLLLFSVGVVATLLVEIVVVLLCWSHIFVGV